LGVDRKQRLYQPGWSQIVVNKWSFVLHRSSCCERFDALSAKGDNVIPVQIGSSLLLESVMGLNSFKLDSRNRCVADQLYLIRASKAACLVFPLNIETGFFSDKYSTKSFFAWLFGFYPFG
jgi:hypothetical protein